MQNENLPSDWRWKKFSELNVYELYAVLELRAKVFVVEQQCVYLDCDRLDFDSWHLSGYVDQRLVAYLRVLPPGLKFAEPALSRVVITPEARGSGQGKALMRVALRKAAETFGSPMIRISAQAYLEKFYESFGFRKVGDGYLEDDIPHLEMLRERSSDPATAI